MPPADVLTVIMGYHVWYVVLVRSAFSAAFSAARQIPASAPAELGPLCPSESILEERQLERSSAKGVNQIRYIPRESAILHGGDPVLFRGWEGSRGSHALIWGM